MTADPIDTIDLFAGPGGWDEGLRMLGICGVLGIEWNAQACATAEASGHRRLGTTVAGERVGADISLLDPRAVVAAQGLDPGEIRRVLGSPPCTTFTPAGKGNGRKDAPLIFDALDLIGDGFDVDAVLGGLYGRCVERSTGLVLEPLRWVLDLLPEMTCWEQVVPVLPLWQACAPILRGAGYRVWTGVLRAERYGVPSTRRRAVLIASRIREVGEPTPTHSAYHPTNPAKLDPGMPRWVSMAEANIGRPGWVMRSNYGTGGDPTARGERTLDQPGPTVTGKIGRNKWMAGGEEIRSVTLEEAAALQTFPTNYPWRGTLGDRFQQVGDAVPPLLGVHVIAEAEGVAAPIAERAA